MKTFRPAGITPLTSLNPSESKVLCVRAPLRMVYAYRGDWEQTRHLMDYLATNVVASLSPAQRLALDGETAVVTGSRGESETFPHGYGSSQKICNMRVV